MFSGVRRRVTFANVAMTLALVFAMSGGAFAAGKFLITSTKQIKPSVLKQLQGKAGAQGLAGAAGLAGPAGPAGAAGKDGAPGTPGVKGETGPEGKAGKDGKNGTTGFTETLPSGKTEKGAWADGSLNASSIQGFFLLVPVASFAIPLTTGMGAGHVHYINPAGKEVIFEAEEYKELTPTQCLGNAANPTAEPGNFCVYAAREEGAIGADLTIISPATTSPSAETIGTTGAIVAFSVRGSPVSVSGTWAVTAP
jgi:Collagen triple helix repeat (20 copies)